MVDAARQRRGSKGVGGLVARETPEERNARRAEARAVKAIRALRAAESRLRTIETDSGIRDGADSGTHGATDATSQLMEQDDAGVWLTVLVPPGTAMAASSVAVSRSIWGTRPHATFHALPVVAFHASANGWNLQCTWH